jgi:hypothetical protein
MGQGHETAGFLLDGARCMIFLGVWCLAVLAHGLFWRSMRSSAPDPIRPSGPID